VSTVSATAPRIRLFARGDRLQLAILLITLIGLLDAAYLVYVHYNGLKGLVCFGASHGHSSCETVQSSVYSKLDGVPVALLGLLGYVVILASQFVRNDFGKAVAMGTALIGCGFSGYLTYREIWTIHAICEWCVGSAVCMTALMILTSVRFIRSAPPLG
jgi:uncharacterized membrane protein